MPRMKTQHCSLQVKELIKDFLVDNFPWFELFLDELIPIIFDKFELSSSLLPKWI